MEQLQKLAELLRSINEKKEQMTKLQKEVEIKIHELDKLLENVAKLRIEKPTKIDVRSTNAKIKPIHKTQES